MLQMRSQGNGSMGGSSGNRGIMSVIKVGELSIKDDNERDLRGASICS